MVTWVVGDRETKFGKLCSIEVSHGACPRSVTMSPNSTRMLTQASLAKSVALGPTEAAVVITESLGCSFYKPLSSVVQLKLH